MHISRGGTRDRAAAGSEAKATGGLRPGFAGAMEDDVRRDAAGPKKNAGRRRGGWRG